MTAFAAAVAAPVTQAAASPTAVPDERAFAADFDRFIFASMARFPSVPALSVAVADADGAIYLRAFGEADRAHRRRATVDTRFYIASSTKSFVAVALARLAARKAIDLDWTLAELAPDIAWAPELHAEQITLRRLLSHSHGLRNDPLQFRLAYSGDYDRATLWRLLAHTSANPRAPLGSFAYSNLGYNIATLLIERRLGRPWQAIVEAEVFAPLGLHASAARGLARIGVARALPYDGFTPLYLVKSDATMQSAGGIESSARDMATWVEANIAAERGRGLLAAALVETHRRFVATDGSYGPFARTGYGLGWYSGPYHGATLYHAFGGFTGARAHVSFMPDIGLGVAVMSNDDGIGYRLVDIVAAYAYDWHREGAAAAARDAGTRLAALKPPEGAAPAAPLSLSRPLPAFAGRFCNDEWGTIAIAPRDGRLRVTMGRLHALAEGGGGGDVARVALIPGERVTMRLAPDAVTAFGARFQRC